MALHWTDFTLICVCSSIFNLQQQSLYILNQIESTFSDKTQIESNFSDYTQIAHQLLSIFPMYT